MGSDFTIVVNSTSPLRTPEEIRESPLNTADQVLSITMAQLNKFQLANADIVITPNLTIHRSEDFINIDYFVQQGKLETAKYIPLIKDKLDSLEVNASPNFNYFLTNPIILFSEGIIPDSIKNSIISSQNNNFVRYTTIERTLRELYKVGFFQDVKAQIIRDSNYLYLKYVVKENPLLKGIHLNGFNDILSKTIMNFESSKLLKPINNYELENFYDYLLGVLRISGFTAANINKYHLDYESGILTIDIDEGVIDTIKLTGNKNVNSSVILNEFDFDLKKPVNIKNLETTLGRIYSLNLFTQLSFNLLQDSIGKTNLFVNTIEKYSRNIRLSMRIDNEKKLQLFFDIRNENLFGNGTNTGFTIFGGIRNQEYKIDMKSNRFFNTVFTYNASLFYSLNDIYTYSEIIDLGNNIFDISQTGEYRSYKYGGTFLLGTQIERIGTIYTSISYQQAYTKILQGNSSPMELYKMLKFRFGGEFDSRDKFPFPTSGIYLNYYYETAQNQITGDEGFSKLYIDFTSYFNIGKYNNLKPKLVFGYTDKTTPLTELFPLGGENTFYGMYENQQIGKQIFLLSLDYMLKMPVKLFFDTYVNFRYDLGRVWDKQEDIHFKDLRHGIGIGINFDTPVGKASFSAGKSFIVNQGSVKDSFIFSPLLFYFSIGYEM